MPFSILRLRQPSLSILERIFLLLLGLFLDTYVGKFPHRRTVNFFSLFSSVLFPRLRSDSCFKIQSNMHSGVPLLSPMRLSLARRYFSPQNTFCLSAPGTVLPYMVKLRPRGKMLWSSVFSRRPPSF